MSLTVVPADAVYYRTGTDFASIAIGDVEYDADNFDGYVPWDYAIVEPEEWKEGEKLFVVISDQDYNLDSTVQEKILLSNSAITTAVEWLGVDPSEGLRFKQSSIPFIVTGNPTGINFDDFQYCYANGDECVVFNNYENSGTTYQA